MYDMPPPPHHPPAAINSQPTMTKQPIDQRTPARVVKKARRSTDVADNPHLLTPPNESASREQRRRARARAFNSRIRRKSRKGELREPAMGLMCFVHFVFITFFCLFRS